MAKLGEEAQAYEAPKTLNIADLDKVSVDLELMDDEFEAVDEHTGQPKVVHQKVVEIKGEKYRVPNSVLKQLKVLLDDDSTIKTVKVKKTGEGLKTTYTVIPITKP